MSEGCVGFKVKDEFEFNSTRESVHERLAAEVSISRGLGNSVKSQD